MSRATMPRNVLTELACVRALLDELDAVIKGDNEQTSAAVLGQVAEDLVRLANLLIRDVQRGALRPRNPRGATDAGSAGGRSATSS